MEMNKTNNSFCSKCLRVGHQNKTGKWKMLWSEDEVILYDKMKKRR